MDSGYGPAIAGIVIAFIVYWWVKLELSDHGWFRTIGGLLVIAGGIFLVTDLLRFAFAR